MKQESHRRLRLLPLTSAAALVANPLAAQVAPPPVAPAASAPVAPPAVSRTVAPSGVTSGARVPGADANSATPVNPEAAAQAEAERAERRAAAPARRAVPPRRAASAPAAAPAATTPAPRPTAAAPAPTPTGGTPTPAATTPTAAPATPAPETTTAATDEATTNETTVNETGSEVPTETGGGFPWWIAGLVALAVIAVGAFLFLRRRRADDAVEEASWAEPQPFAEPAPVAPAPVAAAAAPMAPVAAAPLSAGIAEVDPDAQVAPAVPEDATLVAPPAEDVAALTAGVPAGGDDRPVIEFAMRPVRAGTNVDEALVEIELTVVNAGAVPAEDLRIATFMVPAGASAEMERLLAEPPAAVDPITLDAGAGTRVDATFAMSKAELAEASPGTQFSPVVVADARYRLPDGGEGRISAAFVIGATVEGSDELAPLDLERPLLREDVEARLYQAPERA